MIRAALVVLMATAAAAQASLTLPSGQAVTLHEVLQDGEVQRWRFLAPEVRGLEFEAVMADIEALCAQVVAPSQVARETAQVVVSLMDRVVEFGLADPDARQHFEAFTLENGTCIWEPF